jgi:hypothetical protein
MATAESVRIELKPSWSLVCVLGSVHLAALAAVALALHGAPCLLAGAGIIVSLFVCVAEALHRGSESVIAVELHADGRGAWANQERAWADGRVGDHHFVSPGLTILSLYGNVKRRKAIVLFWDSAEPEALRRLRVWLRWRASPVARTREVTSGVNNPWND